MSDEKEVEEIEKQRDEFRKAANPLIKYLCENYHPYVTAIITSTTIEIVEGIIADDEIYDYVVD